MYDVRVVKYCKKTMNTISEKKMSIDEWKKFKKYTKDFLYKSYQI